MPKQKSIPESYLEMGMRLEPTTHKKLKIFAVTNSLMLVECYEQAINYYLKNVDFTELLQERLNNLDDTKLIDRRNMIKGVNVKVFLPAETIGKFILVADLKGLTISSLLNLIIINWLENKS